ncbi:MAG: hypothetical protein KAH23_06660 [Kiritimatiellae bacterium]|nr:hypothetical protein [Kiritimatiellia bacterium]
MNDSIFQINAPGIDTNAIVEDIRDSVAEKMNQGLYTSAEIARAERTNISSFKDLDEFQTFYLDCLHDAVFVDINDFDIRERRAVFGCLLTFLKRQIWKLLKFYTYRLWSQQNQVNGLLLSAIETTGKRYEEKISKLEARIALLEKEKTGN